MLNGQFASTELVSYGGGGEGGPRELKSKAHYRKIEVHLVLQPGHVPRKLMLAQVPPYMDSSPRAVRQVRVSPLPGKEAEAR